MKNITARELKARLADTDTNEVFIDVRTPAEYRGKRAPEAENIPLDDVEAAAERLKDLGTVYVTCASGVRGQRACQALAAHGVNVVNLEGGMQAWEEAGFELAGSGKTVISMNRQVMIAAGSLVLIGVLLGYFVSSYWYLLAGFVGAGLLFAGVSGICTMTKILAKMPWNK